MPFVTKTERFCSSLVFPTAMKCKKNYNPYTNLQQVYQNYSHNVVGHPQQNVGQWSPHDVDRSVVAPAALHSALSFSHKLSFPLKLILLCF